MLEKKHYFSYSLDKGSEHMKQRYGSLILLMLLACTGCNMTSDSDTIHAGKRMYRTSPMSNQLQQRKMKQTRTSPVDISISHNMVKQLWLPYHVQETNYYCVPACIQIALEYYGIIKTQALLANELHTSSVTGTEYVDMARVLNHHIFGKEEVTLDEAGFRIQTVNRLDRDDNKKDDLARRIKQNIDDHYPVFVAVDLKTVYPEYGVSANHMIIIHGYEMDETNTQLQSVMILDPYEKISSYNRSQIDFSTLYEALIQNEEPAYIY